MKTNQSNEATFTNKYYASNHAQTNKKINNSGFLTQELSPIKSTPS